MTIAAYDPRRSYDTDGVTTTYAGPPAIAASDLAVYAIDNDTGARTDYALNADYTISGAGVLDSNQIRGDTSIVFNPAPADDQQLFIDRAVIATQGTKYPEGGAFPALAHAAGMDRLTMAMQYLALQQTRSILFPEGEAAGVLPIASARANLIIGFDVNGAVALQANGSMQFLFGDGVPSALLGGNGDVYVNNLTGGLYGKAGDAWVIKGTFQGAQGIQGDTGDASTAADGSAASPGLGFTSEATGFYLAAAGDMRAVVAGTDRFKLNSSGFDALTGYLKGKDLVSSGSMFQSGASAPTALSGNVNDYALAANVARVNLTSDAAGRQITGFDATDNSSRRVYLYNANTTAGRYISLIGASASSSAANRIDLDGDTQINLMPGRGLWIYYDATATLWVPERQIDPATTTEAFAKSAKVITADVLAAMDTPVDLGTAGATVTADLATGKHFKFTVGTVAYAFAFSNYNDYIGKRGFVAITTSGKAVTWDTKLKWPGGTKATHSATGKVDWLEYYVAATDTIHVSMAKDVR